MTVTTDETLERDLKMSLVHRQADAIEQVLINGDLAKLSPEQRSAYYLRVCQSLGLNPLTKPFAYITLNGKLTLYALKDCTEQLRSIHDVSITGITSQRLDDVFVVTANAAKPSGRTDAATGAVAIAGLKGENLANALMKAETKAKRRATLSICGLGVLDETEAEPLMARETQQPIVSEAPIRVALPPGTAQIIRVESKSRGAFTWADVTYVTAEGEEKTAVAPGDPRAALVSLCEQLASEQAIVELDVTVNKKGKTEIESINRYRPDGVSMKTLEAGRMDEEPAL